MGNTFGRIVGTVYYACPSCNAVHKANMDATKQETHCPSCNTTWIVALALWEKPRGACHVPRDQLLIGEKFANRRLANRVYCDGCGKALWNDQSPLEKKPRKPYTRPPGKPTGNPRGRPRQYPEGENPNTPPKPWWFKKPGPE
jgi:hypothetical protein